jgi:hypothetical protein
LAHLALRALARSMIDSIISNLVLLKGKIKAGHSCATPWFCCQRLVGIAAERTKKGVLSLF